MHRQKRKVRELIRPTVKLFLVWIGGTFKWRGRDGGLPRIHQLVQPAGEVEEDILPDNWEVALKHVLVVRVPPMAQLERIIDRGGMLFPVSVEGRHA